MLGKLTFGLMLVCVSAAAQSPQSIWERKCVKEPDAYEWHFNLTKPKDAECAFYKGLHDAEIAKQQKMAKLVEDRKIATAQRLIDDENERLKRIEDRQKLIEEAKRFEVQRKIDDENRLRASEAERIKSLEDTERHRLAKVARQQRVEAIRAEMKREEIEAERQERVAAALENARKKKCGEEYKSPALGMTVLRFAECVGKPKLIAQVNRMDGAMVSTYRAGTYTITTIGGKVVAWDKY